MLGRATIRVCLAALLLTPWLTQPSFAQVRQSPPSQSHSPSQHADGQWHHFGNEGHPSHAAPGHPSPSHPNPNHALSGHPSQPHAPQNQPGHAGDWLRRYKDLPPAQQRRALENDPQFRRLPPQQQARLQQRLQHFSSLPREQQERMLNRMQTWEHLTSDQKQRARQLFQQFKQLSPDRRQAVNQAIREMRGLPPGQRDQLINSEQYSREFSLQERVLLEGAAHLPLSPGEGLQAEPPE